jgi:hypothetical protein
MATGNPVTQYQEQNSPERPDLPESIPAEASSELTHAQNLLLYVVRRYSLRTEKGLEDSSLGTLISM